MFEAMVWSVTCQ